MTTFKEFGLHSDLMQSLNDLGFERPSPIQAKAIPFILRSKNDLIALAQTGTGKTAAFGLPILNQIKSKKRELQSIILCPTRELCIQLAQDLKKFAKHSKGIDVTPVYGGERIDIQIRALKRGTNIVVGTPGRVHDLIKRKVLKLQSIKWLVLDEADEMLDMGFKDDLDAILNETPESRQTLLFSATISRSVRSIAQQYMTDALEIKIGESNIGAVNVSHEYYVVGARDRFEALKRILDFLPGVYGILFCRTRRETQEVADKLKIANYDAEPIHGEISQVMRTKIMDRFKRKQIHLLVATDVAARGIDVNDLSHVINYNLPDQNETYTHRSGRTGRAGNSGISVSIVTPRDVRTIRLLENNIGKKFELKKIPNAKDVCKKQIDSFVEEIEKTEMKENANDEHLQESVERLKKFKKEDLIKMFLTNKFNHFTDSYKHARDLNARESAQKPIRDDGDNVALKINFGKNYGLDIKGLFSLLNSNKSLKGVEVGRISLMADNTIFTVEKNSADRVVKVLSKTFFKGKKIVISKTAQAPSYGGRRSGGRPVRRGGSVGRGGAPRGSRPVRRKVSGGAYGGRRKGFKKFK